MDDAGPPEAGAVADPIASIDDAGLPALATWLHDDLLFLNWPAKEWVVPRDARGEHVHDAVIVGGGMCGLVAWMALQSAGIRDVPILDRAEAGREGPWLTYARMETLRSPKQLTGPAFGHGALSFQAWFRAQHGRAGWEALDKIPRPLWAEYLIWYRDVLDIPVDNGVSLDHVHAEGDLLRLDLSTGPVLARKLVMATGREGTGAPNIPAFMEGVPRRRWAHSADEIDFAALRGRRVAVIGVGASAVDNAAEALEAGAAEVRHLIRRDEMPVINKMMGIGSFGFSAGFSDLPDEWRWRFMNYSFTTQTPPPRGSTLRVSRHPHAHFHFGAPVTDVRDHGSGLVIHLGTADALETDFLILGTGFLTDPMARTEFGKAASEIALWRDIYTPPEDEANRELSLFPYLSGDFTFREKRPGAAPWLGNVHCFNYGATASMGKISGDIPGISEGAAWLAKQMAATLYREDVEAHWQRLQDYTTPELNGDEWRETPLPRRKDAVA